MRGRQDGTTLTLLAVLALSCSDSTSSPDDDRPPEETYAARWAEAVCGEMAPCCAANGQAFDEGDCVLGGAAFVTQGVDAALEGGAEFDPEAAGACIAAARELAGQCRPLGIDPVRAEPCDRVFVGDAPLGAACSVATDCALPTDGRRACLEGVCVAEVSPAREGDPCGAPTDDFIVVDCSSSDLQCSLGGTCVPLAEEGEPCGLLLQCAEGLGCGADDTCAPVLDEGETCESDDACASGACLDGQCADNALGRPTPCGN